MSVTYFKATYSRGNTCTCTCSSGATTPQPGTVEPAELVPATYTPVDMHTTDDARIMRRAGCAFCPNGDADCPAGNWCDCASAQCVPGYPACSAMACKSQRGKYLVWSLGSFKSDVCCPPANKRGPTAYGGWVTADGYPHEVAWTCDVPCDV